MEGSRLVQMIDGALERFASRDLIPSAEIVDFLLDLRTACADDEQLRRLLDEESEPAR